MIKLRTSVRHLNLSRGYCSRLGKVSIKKNSCGHNSKRGGGGWIIPCPQFFLLFIPLNIQSKLKHRITYFIAKLWLIKIIMFKRGCLIIPFLSILFPRLYYSDPPQKVLHSWREFWFNINVNLCAKMFHFYSSRMLIWKSKLFFTKFDAMHIFGRI